MAGDKLGGVWRSRFNLKSNTKQNQIDSADLKSIRAKISQDNLRVRSRENKASSKLGIESELELAAGYNVRQQESTMDGDNYLKPGRGSSSKEYLHERRRSGSGGSGSVNGSGNRKSERMMGGDATFDFPRSPSRLPGNGAELYQGNGNKKSQSKVDESSCPVCLELLSFRLAGEKSHVTPLCGHALHHACFTAVYGSPAKILALQNAAGRVTAPGMCGVCRKLIELGDEGENRRQNSECVLCLCLRYLERFSRLDEEGKAKKEEEGAIIKGGARGRRD
ncbi:hypothetical protein CBS101457_004283 [Exobasidium rhododendri]|nr:hypothetical protein CBS101457_004283 [Exobasidium rhododendri]